MTKKRKSLSKKTRFEVFKRDKFTCQYCGKQAPEVVLEADHVNPVSKGGADDLLNLVTSCQDCNGGKGARTLDDDSVLAKQRKEIAALSEKREQITMMLQWRDELKNLGDFEHEEACKRVNSAIAPRSLNDKGRETVRQWLRNFKLKSLLDAVEVAAEKYLKKKDEDWEPDSINQFLDMVPGVARLMRLPEGERRLYYIRGIARKRFLYCNDLEAIKLLKQALSAGVDPIDLESWTKEARNWSEWRSGIYDVMNSEGGSANEVS